MYILSTSYATRIAVTMITWPLILAVGLVLGFAQAGVVQDNVKRETRINDFLSQLFRRQIDDEEPSRWEIMSGENGLYRCNMTEWGPWGQCMRNSPCSTSRGASAGRGQSRMSFSVDVTQEFDSGRSAMAKVIEAKEKEWAAEEECRDSESCPELVTLKTQGPAQCVDGMAGIFPCRHVSLLSFIDFDDLGYTNVSRMGDTISRRRGNDVWGWTDPENKEEYVLMGTRGGMSFLRINDPEDPEVLGFMYGRSYASNWRDMKVVNNHVFIGAEVYNHGIQVYDLTQLRGMTGFREIQADFVYMEVGNTHNIVENDESGFVYGVGSHAENSVEIDPNNPNNTIMHNYTHCAGGLHMIDARDPKNLKFVGCYDADGYSHDAQCVVYRGPDRKYHGREICFNYNEDTLTIVDVQDKANPVTLSKMGYIYRRYVHQGWLTEDHQMILMDDELDELYNDDMENTRTYMWDIRRLERPVMMRAFVATHQTSDHNQYIKDGLSFQSNYKAGLRILWINQRAYDLKEIAHFDVLPSESGTGFLGSWSNYPYFKSGVVAVSSIDYGLFLVKPDYDAIQEELASQSEAGTQTRRRDIIDFGKHARCPGIMEARDCTPEGTCD